MEERIKKEYISFDGLAFDNKEDCERYENEHHNIDEPVNVNGKTLVKADIIDYFNHMECNHCAFRHECTELYNASRRYSTNTFCICEIIKNHILIFD